MCWQYTLHCCNICFELSKYSSRTMQHRGWACCITQGVSVDGHQKLKDLSVAFKIYRILVLDTSMRYTLLSPRSAFVVVNEKETCSK